MKKVLIIFCVLLAALTLVGCAHGVTAPPENPDGITSDNTDKTTEEITVMYVHVNGNKLEVTLDNNSSVDALVALLKQGDIVFTAYENGDFEIYGSIGRSLPTNNTQITAQAGDVLLYAGNNICLFFGSNSYSYTKIGKINGYTAQQLKTLLGGKTVTVTLSLK